MKPDEEVEITTELDAIDSAVITPKDHLSITPKKKRHIVRNIFIVLFLLAALGAGGYIYYLLTKPLEPGEAAPAPVKIAPMSATSLTGQIKLKMTGKIKLMTPSADGAPVATFHAPAYKPDGYDFSVLPTKDTGFQTTGTSDKAKTDLDQIESTLVSHQLEKTVLDAGSPYASYVASYESATIICILSDQKPALADGVYGTTLGCADKSAYTSNAATLKPYFTVYAAESGNNNVQILMNQPDTKDSKTPGYRITTIAIGSSRYGAFGPSVSMFYQTPDKVIHFFKSTQNEIACTDYSTPDLKKAYLGEPCFDSTNPNATVKP